MLHVGVENVPEPTAHLDDVIERAETTSASGIPLKLSAATAARLEFNRRNDRRKIFYNYGVYSDAAWEILLELYIANADGKNLSITSLGLDAKLPLTTCIRWVKILEKVGLVFRAGDNSDARRQWIILTAAAENLLDEYFIR